jgi:hypothetical protein
VSTDKGFGDALGEALAFVIVLLGTVSLACLLFAPFFWMYSRTLPSTLPPHRLQRVDFDGFVCFCTVTEAGNCSTQASATCVPR